MTKKKIQLAIVVDEYGGTEGIISIEDLVEDIMGNIQDEYDNEDEESHKLSENKFTVDGAMTLDDVSELIDYEFPKPTVTLLPDLFLNIQEKSQQKVNILLYMKGT